MDALPQLAACAPPPPLQEVGIDALPQQVASAPPPLQELQTGDLPQQAELCLEGVVLRESSLRISPVLPYVRMLVSLIEGVEFSCQEVVRWLGEILRQHSIAQRPRREYVLRFLHQHPP
jgi:hypothetical protein